MRLTPAQKLLNVTPEIADRQVAMMIADMMVHRAEPPYRFQINHDIRPPKCLACPVEYRWSVKDHVGIEMHNPGLMRMWLTSALLYGYKVEEVDGHRKPKGSRTESIDIVRKRAEYHQRPKSESDDDIPF